MIEKLKADYAQKKADFLDELQPDDFRNGGSFNQAEQILDQLNQALLSHAIKNENPEEFIKKAVSHLFREGSPMVEKAIRLSQSYLEIMPARPFDMQNGKPRKAGHDSCRVSVSQRDEGQIILQNSVKL